jgi:hypothetical protein
MSGPAYGQANASSDTSDYNSIDFIVRAALAGMQTVSVVKVIAVHGGGVAPTGTVDVQVIVNLMTGSGTPVVHDVIYDVPFARAQGGNSAFICDPVVGDMGMAAFASRDISSVKNARGQANPSSKRMFDWSDAIYSSGMLNGTPTQYVELAPAGITAVSPTAITLQSPANEVEGPLEVTGPTTLDSTLHVVGAVTADSTIRAMGEIQSDTLLSAPVIETLDLIVGSGGSISLPAGSVPSSALAASGVTPGSYLSANITVNAEGQVTAAANGSGGGGGSLTVTDGTHTVTGVTSLDVVGGVVSGTTPNATVTISAGTYPGGVSSGLYYWFEGDQLSGAGGASIPQLFNATPVIGAIIPANAIGAGATIGAAALNSLNAANFPGSSAGRYTFPQLPPGPLTQSTAFIVFKPTSAAAIYNFFSGGGSSLQYGTDGSGHLNLVSTFVAVIATSTATIAAGTWYQANATYNSSTGAYAFRLARTADGSGTSVQSITSATSAIGYNQPSGSQDMNGSIAELIIYSRVLTPTEITAVETYLHSKWNV